MGRLEKIPEKWKVVCDECLFNLVDAKGKVKFSIVYRLDEDSSGKKFIELISVASGKEQGRGYYRLLLAGLESLAKTEGVAYFSGAIKPENVRSIQVHEHLGFYPVGYFVYGNGNEKRIEVRRDISI